MTIVPPPAGLRLLKAWRDADGWGLQDSIPVLALAIDPSDLEVHCVTLGTAEPLADTVAARSRRAPVPEFDWVDALLEGNGRVIDAYGQVFTSPESFLAALQRRDEHLAARRAKVPA